MANYLKAFNTEAEKRAFMGANSELGPCVLLIRPDKVQYFKKLPLSGVKIQDIDGNLYTIEEWTAALELGTVTNDIVNGVAVGNGACEFVISKNRGASILDVPADILVDGILTTTSKGKAFTDFDGQANTDAIISTVSENSSSVSYAAIKARNTVFPNGKNGYLMSVGESAAIYDNITLVNQALSIVGGTQFGSTDSYWTSTQASSGHFWYRYGYTDMNYGYVGTCHYRAVCSL